ncbi:hypothetical protein [Flavobacterium sp.]|uniref:hypothetical protein n=1 Tax=Flavobacterium sp. TaxID=239 RepID=UPI0038FC40AE
MKINTEKLYILYTEKINKIADDLPDKSSFEPREIVDIIALILERNPDLITK